MVMFTTQAKSKSIPKVRPGNYEAVIVKVLTSVPGYADGSVIQVEYSVFDEEKVIPYKELLPCTLANPRTESFLGLAKEAGLSFDEVTALEGARVCLTFLKELRGTRIFTNIVGRELILEGDLK